MAQFDNGRPVNSDSSRSYKRGRRSSFNKAWKHTAFGFRPKPAPSRGLSPPRVEQHRQKKDKQKQRKKQPQKTPPRPGWKKKTPNKCNSILRTGNAPSFRIPFLREPKVAKCRTQALDRVSSKKKHKKTTARREDEWLPICCFFFFFFFFLGGGMVSLSERESKNRQKLGQAKAHKLKS